MKEQIEKLVIRVLEELNEEWKIPGLDKPDRETRLFGAKSGMDSIGLVTLIAEIEDRISDEMGREIVLADERAMSQTRSPFRRVESLVEYINTLLDETE